MADKMRFYRSNGTNDIIVYDGLKSIVIQIDNEWQTFEADVNELDFVINSLQTIRQEVLNETKPEVKTTSGSIETI